MYNILCVTNSRSCDFDFFKHIEALSKSNLYGIILREKHLSEIDYYYMAKEVLKICDKNNKLCILHNFVEIALKLNCKSIHLPLNVLEKSKDYSKYFDLIGCSTHSVEQAQLAQYYGANYITYGHIFNTDCKKGLEPKGVETINKIVSSVNIPVYPLGGINKDNIKLVMSQNVNGCAIMSGLMKQGYEDFLT